MNLWHPYTKLRRLLVECEVKEIRLRLRVQCTTDWNNESSLSHHHAKLPWFSNNNKVPLKKYSKTVKFIGNCQSWGWCEDKYLNHCDTDDLFPLSTFLSCCFALVIPFFITGNYLFVGIFQRADLVTKWDQSNLCSRAYLCFTCSQVQLHPNKDIYWMASTSRGAFFGNVPFSITDKKLNQYITLFNS